MSHRFFIVIVRCSSILYVFVYGFSLFMYWWACPTFSLSMRASGEINLKNIKKILYKKNWKFRTLCIGHSPLCTMTFLNHVNPFQLAKISSLSEMIMYHFHECITIFPKFTHFVFLPIIIILRARNEDTFFKIFIYLLSTWQMSENCFNIIKFPKIVSKKTFSLVFLILGLNSNDWNIFSRICCDQVTESTYELSRVSDWLFWVFAHFYDKREYLHFFFGLLNRII